MFKKFKAWYRRESVNKWIEQLHDPLFMLKNRLEYIHRVELESHISFLHETIEDLENKVGKDEQQIVKERWQAIKFRKAMEMYRVALIKLEELVHNLPERPEIEEYDIQIFNGFNDPNDDL